MIIFECACINCTLIKQNETKHSNIKVLWTQNYSYMVSMLVCVVHCSEVWSFDYYVLFFHLSVQVMIISRSINAFH